MNKHYIDKIMDTHAKESTVDTCTRSHYASSSEQDFALVHVHTEEK